MDTEIKIIVGIGTVIGLFILGWIFIGLVGFHLETGKGTHVGFITSTETSGVLFKTDRAYIKTDTQSSQEDAYCVVDDNVFADLRKFSESHSRVEVSYFDWFSKGIANCGGEKGGVISGVKLIN